MEHTLVNNHGNISGSIAIKLANGQTLDDFCAEHIENYNRDRFEAIAIRLFVGNETVITIYALDKLKQEVDKYDVSKIPVKKFKITTLKANSLFSYCSSINFTLATGNYSIEDMLVLNK